MSVHSFYSGNRMVVPGLKSSGAKQGLVRSSAEIGMLLAAATEARLSFSPGGHACFSRCFLWAKAENSTDVMVTARAMPQMARMVDTPVLAAFA